MGEVGKVKINYSFTYIIPLIDSFVPINKSSLINTFLFDVNYPEYNSDMVRGIFILLKYEKDNNINKVITESRYHIMHYTVDEFSYMVYIKFPLDIINDSVSILKGNYSKVSEKSKGLIVRYHNQTSKDKLYKVLHKSPDLKKELEILLDVKIEDDVELGNIIDQSKEVFTKNVNSVSLEN